MRILKYDLNGKYLYGWGGPGGQPGQFNGPHSLTVDQEGNLYIGRGLQRPRAEVPAEAGRRPGQGDGTGAALPRRDEVRTVGAGRTGGTAGRRRNAEAV